MKKQLFSFLLLISLFVSVSAQTTKQSAPKPDLTEQNLRKHVEYLASDKLEGRRTGERGATWAAGYVANMFSNYRLKGGFIEISQGKTKTSFLQPFPFSTGVQLSKEGNEFHLEIVNSAGQSITPSDLAPWKPVGFSPNAQVEDTPIVFAGYGVSSADLKYDDYANLNVAGKIVLAFDGTPEIGQPNSPFARFDVRAKAKIAKDKGAKALFLISREDKLENNPLTSLKFDQTPGEAALPTMVVSRMVAAAILGTDEAGLKRNEDIFQLRRENEIKDLQATLSKRPEVRAAFKINFVKKQIEGYSVIGILEGTDPTLKNEAIIIGAHYDHLGRGGQGSLAANSTEIHHGADDNASGVAGLLELARQFSEEKKNKRTIIFIAFGGEEEGLIGSKFYVNNPVFPLARTVAMINLDMVGRLKDNKLNIGGIGTASEMKSLVENTNLKLSTPTFLNASNNKNEALKAEIEGRLKERGFTAVAVEIEDGLTTLKGTVRKGELAEVMSIAVKANQGRPVKNQLTESQSGNTRKGEKTSTPPVEKSATPKFEKPFTLSLNEDGFGPSDHSSFYSKQIPVLFFFTGSHAEYHKPTDTADKINYSGLKQITSFISEIVKAIDQNPKRPTYTQAKSSGTAGGRATFNVSLGTIPSYTESTDGLVLDGVRDNGPAAKAGLKAGDKIVRLAGKEIRNISDYTFVLGELKANTEYEIVIKRGNENLTLKIVPTTRQ